MDITTELEQGVNGEDFVPSILSKDDNVCAVLQDDGVINEASPWPSHRARTSRAGRGAG